MKQPWQWSWASWRRTQTWMKLWTLKRCTGLYRICSCSVWRCSTLKKNLDHQLSFCFTDDENRSNAYSKTQHSSFFLKDIFFFFLFISNLFPHKLCSVRVAALTGSRIDTCFPFSKGGCASKALQRSACPETLFLTAFLTSSVILCLTEEASRGSRTHEQKNDSDVMGFLLIFLPCTYNGSHDAKKKNNKKKQFALNHFHVF